MTLEPGTSLGRYQVLGPLGHGGMASVYRAFQPALERVVALKVLRPAYAGDPEFLERFRREAKAIARLRHPHIVQIHDFEESDGQIFLVMEHIEGGTLKQRLSQLTREGRRLPAAEVGRIVREVAEALAHAHAQGIVHRDVKPSNVMLTRDGKAVVTDFGIAKILAAVGATQTGVGIGTPEYMSPEQGQAASSVDQRSDIYSLGVLAYELLTGRVPFSADTPLAVMLAHVRDPLPLPSRVDPRIGPRTEQVLLRALAKDPSARYGEATELAAALENALAAEAARADATPAVAPTLTRAAPVRPRGFALPRLPIPTSPFAAGVAGGILALGLLGGGAAVLGVFGQAAPVPSGTLANSAAMSVPSTAPVGSPPARASIAVDATPSVAAAPGPTVPAATATLPPTPVAALPRTTAALPAATATVPPATAVPTPRPEASLDPLAPRFRIIGTVTSAANGSPMAGTSVVVLAADGSCCLPLATTSTDQRGQYLVLLPSGVYRLRVQPDRETGHVTTYWRGVLSYARATDLVVTGQDVTGIDVSVPTGFLVTGRVTDASGGGIAASIAFNDAEFSDRGVNPIVEGASTDPSGNFSIRLQNANYQISVWRGVGPIGGRGPDGQFTLTVSGRDLPGVVFTLR